MRPPIVYVDESGNSGQNLLDRQQPVFVIAAVRLDEAVSVRLATGLALSPHTVLSLVTALATVPPTDGVDVLLL